MSDTALSPPARGMTVNEVARLLRIGPDRIRGLIRRGELPAINTAPARCRRPRFVVLPAGLAEFQRRHRAAEQPKASRRRSMTCATDYYPD